VRIYNLPEFPKNIKLIDLDATNLEKIPKLPEGLLCFFIEWNNLIEEYPDIELPKSIELASGDHISYDKYNRRNYFKRGGL
jgi:hypothetical protein